MFTLVDILIHLILNLMEASLIQSLTPKTNQY